MPHRVAITALALAGCAVARESEETHAEQWKEEFKDLPLARRGGFDLLFVIDDSSSMADEQARLAANYPVFANVLETYEGGLPDVHIGVVSTDVGVHGGALMVGDAACRPAAVPFIVDLADGGGGRFRNYPGTLGDALACNANLGASGSDDAQHLEAMRLALEGAHPHFVREHDFLGIVIIADEDDGSSGEVVEYVDFLKGLKEDAAAIVVALIGDPGSVRLQDFLQRFPNRNAYTTIHNNDLSDGIPYFGDPFGGEQLGNPCIEAELYDTDPDLDGLQYECTASIVVDPGHPDQDETLLHHCDPTSTFSWPCWTLVEDRQACPETPTGLTLVVERLGHVPPGSHLHARCRSE
jgi:hypothetical protein